MVNQLHNEQILLIGFPAWEGDYLKSTVLLASELAKNNEVLYVEYPFTYKDVLMGRLGKSKAPWKRIMGKEARLRSMELGNGAGINVLTLPPVLPVNFLNSEVLYDALMLQNAKKAFKCIDKTLKELGMERPVVINAFNPFLGVFLARQFEERALIYYCYDEIGAAKWAGKHGPRLEQHFMREADAVIVSSQPLFETKKQYANEIFLVKNGVDFDLFNSAKASKKKNDKKVVGYLGTVDDRLDFDLLETTIKSLKNYRFRFVGRLMSSEVNRLKKYGNVEILGPQAADSLPQWVQTFDVCIIPFEKNEFTSGIYPLKINEYFAAGKPVVTTNFSDLSDFSHLAIIVNDKKDFAALIDHSLQQDDAMRAKARKAFACENSWNNRAMEMCKAIQFVLKGKEGKKKPTNGIGCQTTSTAGVKRVLHFFRLKTPRKNKTELSPETVP